MIPLPSLTREPRVHKKIILLVVLILLLSGVEPAFAWGPLTHLYLGQQLLWKHALLPAGLYLLLKKHRKDFLYGNISADIIVGKQLLDFERHCHNWKVARQLLDNSGDDRQKAFSYGYLAHLAADTVAHNHFIPKYLLMASDTKHFGHSYWEMRADAMVDRRYRKIAEELDSEIREYHNPLMEQTLTRALFSFKTNKRVFDSILYLSRLHQWESLTAFFSNHSPVALPADELADLQRESLHRMAAIMTDPFDEKVTLHDPTGGKKMYESRLTRKSLKPLVRQGIVNEEVYRKVAEALYSWEALEEVLNKSG